MNKSHRLAALLLAAAITLSAGCAGDQAAGSEGGTSVTESAATTESTKAPEESQPTKETTTPPVGATATEDTTSPTEPTAPAESSAATTPAETTTATTATVITTTTSAEHLPEEVPDDEPSKPLQMSALLGLANPFSIVKLDIVHFTPSGDVIETSAESSTDCTLLNMQIHSTVVTRLNESTSPYSPEYTLYFSDEAEKVYSVDLSLTENKLWYRGEAYSIVENAVNAEFLRRLTQNGGSAILPDDLPMEIPAYEPLPECEVPVHRPINCGGDYILISAVPTEIYYNTLDGISAAIGEPIKLMVPYQMYDMLKGCDEVIFDIPDGSGFDDSQDIRFFEEYQPLYTFTKSGFYPDEILLIKDGALIKYPTAAAEDEWLKRLDANTTLIEFYEDFSYGMTVEQLDGFIADMHEDILSTVKIMEEDGVDFELLPGAYNFYQGLCIKATVAFE